MGVTLFFWAILLARQGAFVWLNWDGLRISGARSIADGLWQGLRFEAATLGYVLSPMLLLFYAVAVTGWRSLRWTLSAYAVVLCPA